MAPQLSPEQIVEGLANASPLEERRLRADLLRIGEAAVPALIRAVESQESSKCTYAADILTAINPQAAFHTLITALNSANLNLRQKAIDLLGDIGNQDAVPILIDHLRQERPFLQIYVIQSLGKLKDKRAVDSLIPLLQSDVPSSLRYTTVEALGLIGDKKALPMIRALRDDPDHHVRSRVEIALKSLGETPQI